MMNRMMGALAACAVAAGLAGTADAETLRLSTQGNPPHPWLDAAETLKAEVEAATDGRIEIEIFPGATLGRDATALDEMRLGTIDLLIGGTQEATPFFPEFQLLVDAVKTCRQGGGEDQEGVHVGAGRAQLQPCRLG